MSTLGLSGPPSRHEPFLKRLFWPSAGNYEDADALGQQGFWICLLIALMTLLTGITSGTWITGLVAALFFFLGGIGVREHDIVAALSVSLVYWSDLLVQFAARQVPGILALVAAVLLASNIRACIVASASAETLSEDELPMRFSDTWRDTLVDQMPARVWPKLRGVFYLFAAVALLLLGLGTWAAFRR